MSAPERTVSELALELVGLLQGSPQSSAERRCIQDLAAALSRERRERFLASLEPPALELQPTLPSGRGRPAVVNSGTQEPEAGEPGFYWVLIAHDPDADADWINQHQPAYFDGERWALLGCESEWALRWVGERILMTEPSPSTAARLYAAVRPVADLVQAMEWDPVLERMPDDHPVITLIAERPVDSRITAGDLRRIARAADAARPPALSPLDGWLPIESAPRDGLTRIMLGHWFVDELTGYHGGNRWLWQASGCSDEEGVHADVVDDYIVQSGHTTATHWRLLGMGEGSPLDGGWQPMSTAPRDGTWVLLAGGRTNEHDDEKDEVRQDRPVVGRAPPTGRSVCFWEDDDDHDHDLWVFSHWDGSWYSVYCDPQRWRPLE